MTTQTDFAAIAALDLDRIKTKLCHVESGEGWSRARADAAEVEYRRFLYLMKTYPTESSTKFLSSTQIPKQKMRVAVGFARHLWDAWFSL